MSSCKGKAKTFSRGQEPDPVLLNHFRGHHNSILTIKFHPNLDSVFTGGADGFVMSWNYRQEARALRFEGHTGPVNDLDLSKSGELMVTGSDDHTIRAWVPIIRGEFLSFKGHTASVRSTMFNPVDNTTIVSGSDDKTIKLWSVLTGKTKAHQTKFKTQQFLRSFNVHKNWVRCVRYSSDGNTLCSASDDKTMRIFDIRIPDDTAHVQTFQCPVGSPLSVAFNPTSPSCVGMSTTEEAFLLYDMRNENVIQAYQKLVKGPIHDFDFNTSGDFATCVGEDGMIKILDLVEGRPMFTLCAPRQALYATTFASNGLLATGGKDKELLIWKPTLIPYDAENDESLAAQNLNSSSSTSAKSQSDLTSVASSDQLSDLENEVQV